ncbi:MAG: cytidine deaminase [Firmicutes bacterium]|nr:cytidine deaminase [Bacillota bacterium]
MEIPEKTRQELIRQAFAARERAYAPYSHYKVGAALLCQDGTIVTGCNVECAAFGVGQCAERCALTKAVSEGERTFSAIAIAAALDSAVDLAEEPYPTPCGACRQGLREFVDPEAFQVIMARSLTDCRIMSLEELLPASFGPSAL